MAQRDMKEQEPTELRSPKITLCANSCGFPGNPATQNLCQNCFLATHAAMSAPPSPSTPTPSPSSSSSSSSTPVVVVDKPTRPAPVAEARAELAGPAADPQAALRTSPVNRCSTCRKRVGLTGFPCRCGELFCGAHRYSDRHGCSFDYKAAGRDAIARENPVVRAAKIVRF